MAEEYAYINEATGKEVVVYNINNGIILSQKGYIRKGFTDEQGVTRHAMPRRKVESLYNQLQNFIADCTVEEYKANEQAFTAIKTLLHQRMQ